MNDDESKENTEENVPPKPGNAQITYLKENFSLDEVKNKEKKKDD